MQKALDTAQRSAQVESKRRQIAIGAAIVGVIFVVIGALAGWGWFLVAAASLATAGVQWLMAGKEQRNAVEEGERMKKALVSDVEQRVETFAKVRRELQDRQSAVDSDLTALRAALA
jgi:hypothetical protein